MDEDLTIEHYMNTTLFLYPWKSTNLSKFNNTHIVQLGLMTGCLIKYLALVSRHK